MKFVKLLKCWTWLDGKRHRRSFTATTINLSTCYGRGGANIIYYGITAEGKRKRLPLSFTYQPSEDKTQITITIP